jgi:hypothetical protein
MTWDRVMGFPRRVRWLEGRHSDVDGIPFAMPVRTRTSPALFAGFSIDPRQAEQLLPGQELHPVTLFGRGVFVLAVVNYLDTTIGRYVEFCAGILVNRGVRRPPTLASLVAQKHFGLGVYIYDLPVSTEISVKGGLGIWGMPKRQANLDYVIGSDTVSSQYDLDGQLAVRIDIPKPKAANLPLRLEGVGYGGYRGMLYKSYIHLRGHVGMRIGSHGARLLVGDHPRMDPIKALDIGPRALFSGFAPHIDGVLDDHIETWYLTADEPPEPPPVGMASVVDLSLSQQWLSPPDRDHSDRLFELLTPGEAVGRRSQPLSSWDTGKERTLR